MRQPERFTVIKPVRFTPTMAEQMDAEAVKNGMSLAEYVRQLHCDRNQVKSEYGELLKEWEITRRYVLHILEKFPFEAGEILATVEMKIKVLNAKMEQL